MRLTAFVITAAVIQLAPRPADLPFRIHPVDGGSSETAAVADLDRDGRLDIISGEYWYQAPGWTRHRFREVGFSNNYIDSFSLMPIDVDADGFVDLADVSWFARKLAWWKNPGRSSGAGLWREFTINNCCNIEFAVLADMDNDGNALEIVAQENGTGQAWYEAKGGAWVRHTVSDRSFGHGIGAGDIDGDGRADILTPRGWLQAPPDPRAPGHWTFHNAWEGINLPIPGAGRPPLPPPGDARDGAPAPVLELGFMHVADVNGDGRNDVLAAAGHNFGVFWFQQNEGGTWTRRVIDHAWSQGHASTLVDLNGDGRKDLVTGKRFMAHNGTDPGEGEPLGLYWYESRALPASTTGRGAAGSGGVEWIRHVISYGGQVGAGMQIPVADVDADGDLDLAVGGKSGLFLIENLTRDPRR